MKHEELIGKTYVYCRSAINNLLVCRESCTDVFELQKVDDLITYFRVTANKLMDFYDSLHPEIPEIIEECQTWKELDEHSIIEDIHLHKWSGKSNPNTTKTLRKEKLSNE